MALIFFLFLLQMLTAVDPHPELEPTKNHERTRLRRQFEHSRNGPQIDLNITVPYIFSARLYPYGLSKGDQITHLDPQPVDLHVPLQFFGGQYQTIFIHKDGVIAASPTTSFLPMPPQNQMPLIAVYWMQSRGGRVFYRETTDSSIMSLVQSEVNIQYRYGNSFKPKSVLIVTWEDSSDSTEINDKDGNVFQIALVLAESGCFAHIIYSRLHTNNNAAAGFSGANGNGGHFSLPGSGTPNAIQLMEKSNIGIPGEWLFRIDEAQIYLCGAGFQGIECVDSCGPTQWYLDCSRTCHCADGVACDVETGACPEAKCSPGWTGEPICNEDVDECDTDTNLCPIEQPDCVNTLGAYLCLCFEYDNVTNTCKGSNGGQSQKIPVPVMPLIPQISSLNEHPQKKRPLVRLEGTSTRNIQTSARLFTTPPTTQTPSLAPILMQTLQPLTIKPILSNQKPKLSAAKACPRCDPHAICVDAECTCNPGYEGNGIDCVDIDECHIDQICGENSECQNSAGSYQCICNSGFLATSNGCVDSDECVESSVTCRGGNTSVCVNKPGSFECKCADGYLGDPDSREGCVDFNECDTPELYCGNKSKCKNLPGSFMCQCFEGYEKARNSTQCVDSNECLLSPCDKNAVCTNLDGTFACDCVEGFVGSGIECRETILFPIGRNVSVLPVVENANIPYRLEAPLQLFNHLYDIAYVSANGLVSFDRPFSEIVPQPRELRSVVIFPFHVQNNLGTGGNVSVRQVTEADASNYGLLTKASLIVQNKFNLKRFQATSVFIVTYDRVLTANSNKVNTYQFVIAQSTNTTFVVFLYEKMEDLNSHFVGITNPNGFIELPTNELVRRSNIGQPGKWIFQISNSGHISHCPVGKLNPPFCEQDCEPGKWGFECENVCRCFNNMPCDFISGFCSSGACAPGYTGVNCAEDLNECSAHWLNKCHANATCTNIPGSYQCNCNDQFFGDGFSCKASNRCYKRFNKECAKNAYCDETNIDYPECVCHEGFHGDGRRLCESDLRTSSTTEPSTSTTTRQRVIISNGRSKEASDESPFLRNNWNSIENAAVPTRPTTRSPPKANEHPTKIVHKQPKNHNKNEENSVIEDELADEGKADSIQEDTSERMLLYLILPGIFMGIWFVLIIAIIVICCRRKRRNRVNKFSPQMMGWSPRDNYTSTRNSYFSQTTFT